MAEIAAGSAVVWVGATLLGLIGGGALLASALGKNAGGGGCGTCPPGQVCNPATNKCAAPGTCGGCPHCGPGYQCDITTCQCVGGPVAQPCPGGCPGGQFCDETPCGQNLTTGCGRCTGQVQPCSPPCGSGTYCDEFDCPSSGATTGCGSCVQNGFCRENTQCPVGWTCSMFDCGTPPPAGCGTCLAPGTCLSDFDCPAGQNCLGVGGLTPGTCGNPPPTWGFPGLGAQVSPGHVSAMGGDSVAVSFSLQYTGPGGNVSYGVYAFETTGSCLYSFEAPGGVFLDVASSPTRAFVSFSFLWPSTCVDCLLGAVFDIVPFVIDPNGQEWRGSPCSGCLSC